MTDKPQPQNDNLGPMGQTYLAIVLFGVAIVAVLAVAMLCLGPVMGLSVNLYNQLAGG